MKNSLPSILTLLCSLCLLSCDDEKGGNDQPGTGPSVETFAGSTLGFTDGSGSDAQFYMPSKMALSSDGDLYVVDQAGSSLRKISSTGDVTTIYTGDPREIYAVAVSSNGTVFLAGSSWIGKLQSYGALKVLVDGQQLPPAHSFAGLTSMEILPDGSLLVFETSNYRIINISTEGDVIAVFCSHLFGYQGGESNGKLEDIYFSYVWDIFAADNGEIFFTDWLNHDVRKISTDKMVTTVAGDGDGNPFSFPASVVAAKDGTLYLINVHQIKMIDSSGTISTFAGRVAGYLDANGTSAQFSSPNDMVMSKDGHTLYVSDAGNNRIRKITF